MKIINNFLKRNLISGILIITPIFLTIWIFTYLVVKLDNFVKPFKKYLVPEQVSDLLPFEIHGYGIIFTFITVLVVGLIGRNVIGQFFLKFSEKWLEKIPIIPKVYSSIKQVLKTFMGDDKGKYNGVCLVEYPKNDLWTLALITGEPKQKLADSIGEEKLVSLYVPTTPNPTSGYYLITKESKIKKVDMSVEKALKLIISCGIIQDKKQDELES